MVADIVGHFVMKAGEELLILIGKGLGNVDLWCERRFGRPLSGRLGKVEMQSLFHGNTKDQDQI